MIVGLVKEIKDNEFRVGLTPNCVKAYVQDGNQVIFEANAGAGSGFADEEYLAAGAEIYPDAAAVWNAAEMIVKVKEPIACEYQYLREDLILYTYLHLAADAPLTEVLLKNKVKSIAYETIVGPQGGLPCLQPMSEIAGRLSLQEGAKYLEKTYGGRGILLSGVPGVKKGKVVILGGGAVGTNACKIAVGMGADVTILDVSPARLACLDDIFGSSIQTLYSTRPNIQAEIADADLVIGAVLLPGRAAPKLIMKEDLKLMKKGAVLVDVAVDQGGCIETSHPTTHQDPIFEVDGIIHYCVANMPGAVARTSTLALTSTTLNYGLAIAKNGCEKAALSDPSIYQGVNTYAGKCTYAGVAETLNLEFTEVRELITS